MNQVDPLTGESFVPRRRNQKFASPKNRIRYHNNRSNLERETKAFIDRPFRKNHRILMELLKPNESRVFTREFLAGKGYDPYVLSHYEEHEGRACPAIYNFILTSIEANSPNITIYRKR